MFFVPIGLFFSVSSSVSALIWLYFASPTPLRLRSGSFLRLQLLCCSDLALFCIGGSLHVEFGILLFAFSCYLNYPAQIGALAQKPTPNTRTSPSMSFRVRYLLSHRHTDHTSAPIYIRSALLRCGIFSVLRRYRGIARGNLRYEIRTSSMLIPALYEKVHAPG